MRKIGTYELKTHLAEVLDSVEHGQTVIVTRHGKPIARILPDAQIKQKIASDAVKALLKFPRTSLPKGITVHSLIDEGRR